MAKQEFRYIYEGDEFTDPALVGMKCNPVWCIPVWQGTRIVSGYRAGAPMGRAMLVEDENGKRHVVNIAGIKANGERIK